MTTKKCLPYEEIIKIFKVGDKIRLVNSYDMVATNGATATVIGFEESTFNSGFYYVSVKWDRNEFSKFQNDGGYYASDFELPVVENNKCPRCSGEMVKKSSENYGTINKCKKCGWC